MQDLLRERIKPYLKAKDISKDAFEDACLQQSNVLVDGYYLSTDKTVAPFICSFCSHHGDDEAKVDGLLSQWRGYGRDGGFAIEFDTPELEALMRKASKHHSHSGYYMASVMYGDSSQDLGFLKQDIDVVTDTAFEMLLHK
jgi:hypothetical protein